MSAAGRSQLHPRPEHLIPLMVAAGAAGSDIGKRAFHDRLLGKAGGRFSVRLRSELLRLAEGRQRGARPLGRPTLAESTEDGDFTCPLPQAQCDAHPVARHTIIGGWNHRSSPANDARFWPRLADHAGRRVAIGVGRRDVPFRDHHRRRAGRTGGKTSEPSTTHRSPPTVSSAPSACQMFGESRGALGALYVSQSRRASRQRRPWPTAWA